MAKISTGRIAPAGGAAWLPVALCAGLIAWGMSAAPAEANAVMQADAERGGELAEQWCNACHSVGGEPPRMFDAGPLFSELAKEEADYLSNAIVAPHDFMPEFPSLDESDIDDLVAYIRTVQ